MGQIGQNALEMKEIGTAPWPQGQLHGILGIRLACGWRIDATAGFPPQRQWIRRRRPRRGLKGVRTVQGGAKYQRTSELNHGTGMRHLRQRTAVRQQHLTRTQRQPAPVECKSAGSQGTGERRSQADPGVHQLHQERKDRQGLTAGLRFQGSVIDARARLFSDGLLLCLKSDRHAGRLLRFFRSIRGTESRVFCRQPPGQARGHCSIWPAAGGSVAQRAFAQIESSYNSVLDYFCFVQQIGVRLPESSAQATFYRFSWRSCL